MAKNIINENLLMGLTFAGGYWGLSCDDKQQSFKDLLYAISANVFNEDTKNMSEVDAQKKIDSTRQILEEIAESCIDVENMVIHYDEEKIAKMTKEHGLEYADNAMAGIIQYVALKMGYDLASEWQDFRSKGKFEAKKENGNKPLCIDLKLEKCQPVTDKEMAISIIMTVSEDNDRFIEEGKISKIDQFGLIRQNEELAKLMADIILATSAEKKAALIQEDKDIEAKAEEIFPSRSGKKDDKIK